MAGGALLGAVRQGYPQGSWGFLRNELEPLTMKGFMAANGIVNINLATDYICAKGLEADSGFSVLQVHKLLYYVQAWHMALYGKRIFREEFQAWVHGPVCREVYDRFKSRSMYSVLGADVIQNTDFASLDSGARNHIDNVLERYGALTGTQLEDLTHEEEPWIRARGGRAPLARCEEVIEVAVMQSYYSRKLA